MLKSVQYRFPGIDLGANSDGLLDYLVSIEAVAKLELSLHRNPDSGDFLLP